MKGSENKCKPYFWESHLVALATRCVYRVLFQYHSGLLAKTLNDQPHLPCSTVLYCEMFPKRLSCFVFYDFAVI